jgi:ethanolamine utilization cobalamin adenosyltransferase
MLFTKEAARANVRNREGKRVFYLGKNDQLNSEAKDWLQAQRIEVLPAEAAKKEQYALPTGGFVTQKPEHMTHLNGDVLVHKSHPRIRFRGTMDLLEAEILLCQKAFIHLQEPLQELLDLAREVIRCDVLESPLAQRNLCGLDEGQLRQHSHFPQKYYGIAHFMPGVQDKESVLALNRVRCVARQAELLAVEAFCDREGNPTRTDILQALNRMSSTVYILMIREKAGKE